MQRGAPDMPTETLSLVPTLRARLAALPQRLIAHVERVRGIARELAGLHGIDVGRADLAAAAHDVARHLPPGQLLAEASRLGLPIAPEERNAPVLLHGAVGAMWLYEDDELKDAELLAAVRWHTTAHPDMTPLGRVVFIADKLDPAKSQAYPFQTAVRAEALRNLDGAVLAFLEGALRQQLAQRMAIHPTAVQARNSLLFTTTC